MSKSLYNLRKPGMPALVALLTVHAVAMSGRTLAQFAIPMFVLITTGSTVKTALIGVCVLLPLIGGAVLGGGIVDRVGPRRASAIADVGTALSLASIPLLYGLGLLSFPLLMAIVLTSAMFDSPALAARDALTPELAGSAGLALEPINAVVQVIENAATLIGPITAGLLIVTLGPASTLYMASAVFIVAALLMLGLLQPGLIRAVHHEQPHHGWLRDLRVGWQFIRRTPCLLAMAVIIGSLYALIEPLFLVVLPALSQQPGVGADDVGRLYAALGAGLLISAVAYGSFGHRYVSRRSTLLGGICAIACGMVIAALNPVYEVILPVMFLVGLPAGALAPLLFTVMQEATPAGLRGRVFSTMTALCLAGTPVAVLVSGFTLEHLGLYATLAMLASGFTAVTLTVLLGGSYRLIDEPAAQAPAPQHRPVPPGSHG